jgi:hypothetical protein
MVERLSEQVHFRRASFCGEGGCVEVAALPGDEIVIRDSKDTRPDAPRLSFTAVEWVAFLAGVGAGEFTRSALAADR